MKKFIVIAPNVILAFVLGFFTTIYSVGFWHVATQYYGVDGYPFIYAEMEDWNLYHDTLSAFILDIFFWAVVWIILIFLILKFWKVALSKLSNKDMWYRLGYIIIILGFIFVLMFVDGVDFFNIHRSFVPQPIRLDEYFR